jgi:hypothetical protein
MLMVRPGRLVFSMMTSMLVGASSAAAQVPEQDRALATALFNEGKALMAEGKVSEGCRKLEESQRLDPKPGTLLNVAACHEREGLTASAWVEFREARVLAERDGRDDRVAFADQHMKDLEARLSWMVIVVAPEADVPELRVVRDGTPIGRGAWSSRIPLDPGEHVVEATAPGKKSSRIVVTVKTAGEATTVTIGPLEDAPSPPAAEPGPAPPPRDSNGLSTRRTVALAVVGAGVAGLAVGTIFGVRALEKHGDPKATCTDRPCDVANALNDEAKRAADTSTVAFGVGLAAVAAGAILWFGDKPSRPSQLRLAPVWSPAGAGLAASGGF